MKTDNLNQPGERTHGVVRGHIGRGRAGFSGMTIRDAATTATETVDMTFRGAHITDNDDGTVIVEFDEASILAAGAPIDHGAMGATETVNIAEGSWHRGTLNDDCTITVEGFTADEGVVCVFEVTQNATGGFGITWDPDVDFGTGDDQPETTVLATTIFLLVSSVGDTAIYGFKVGAGGSSVGALDDLSDVTITAPAADDTLRFVGSVWINDNRRWEAVTDGEDVFVWVGDDLVHEWKAY